MILRQLTVAALLGAATAAAQQPFELNTDFRTQFQKIVVGDVLERPDGKIIVSGAFVPPGGDPTSPWGGGLLEANGAWIPFPGPVGFRWYALMGGEMVPWGDRFYVANGQGLQRYWMDGDRDTTFSVMNQSLYSIITGVRDNLRSA